MKTILFRERFSLLLVIEVCKNLLHTIDRALQLGSYFRAFGSNAGLSTRDIDTTGSMTATTVITGTAICYRDSSVDVHN